MSDLTDEQAEEIAERVARKIMEEKRAAWIDSETHAKHHNWVKNKMQDEDDWRAMRKRIIESSLAWALPIFITAMCTALWQYFKHHVTK